MVGVGHISCSAYLWPPPSFAFARLKSLYAPDGIMMAALTQLLARTVERLVEQPFWALETPLLQIRQRVFTARGLLAFGFVGASLNSDLGEGFEERFPPHLLRFAEAEKNRQASAVIP